MNKLIATIFLASAIWSVQSAEFGFEGGVSNVSAAIKADATAAFATIGYTPHKGALTGAAFYAWTGPIIAEVNGGNFGSGGNGYVTIGGGIEYDVGGMAVWWISGNDLTFNRTAAPTEAEVEDALSIFVSLY